MGRRVGVKSAGVVPVLYEVEALVIGGGLAGVAAASELGARGRAVALIESRTFLGRELTAWQRPWVAWREADRKILSSWLPIEEAGEGAGEGDVIPLHMDRLKLKLEARLLDAGVTLLYASRPVGYRRQESWWIVLIGNKSGRQAIRARCVIDASERGIMEWLAGLGQYLRPGAIATMRRTIEFTGAPGAAGRSYPAPAELGVVGDTVNVYPGGFSDDHVYVDVGVEVQTPERPSIWWDYEAETACRTKSLEVAEHLVSTVPEFAAAKLGLGSPEAMRGDPVDAAAALRCGAELADEVLSGERPQSYRVIGHEWRELPLPETPVEGESRGAELEWMEKSEFASEWPGEMVPADVHELEVLSEADVAVVGGGTSGAPAARAAALSGARTALVEMNPCLGGTGTAGSIRSYWMTSPDVRWTSPNAVSDEIDRRVAVWEVRVGYPRRPWTWVRRDRQGRPQWWGEDRAWSIEVKAHVLSEMCREVGVSVFFESFCIGALLRGQGVVGVVLATPYGPRALLSQVTIDATGDGDVAAFAGADFVFGNERDRLTMWACLPFYREPGGLGSHFTTTVDVGDVLDYTRFILTCRRRGRNLHDHGSYVAPRETRHVLGETLITIEDELLLRRYSDTVAVFFSNYDMKGGHVADLVDFGMNPPHLDIEIPYRALLPRALHQLLIAGKAFSLTHDASAAPRMQRDLQLLGGVVGMAAAQAIRDGVSLKALSVAKLQRRLIESGNLPRRVLERECTAAPPRLAELVAALTGGERFEWLEMLSTERATEVPPIVRLCCAPQEEVLPLLRDAFPAARGRRRLLLARLLLWHGCADGLSEVLDEIDRHWRESDVLPQCTRDLWWVSGAPDHGVMPEVVYLLHGLSRVTDRSVLPAFQEAVSRIERAERDYGDERTRVFDYVRVVAAAAERLGWEEFVPLLERLLALPELEESLARPSISTDHLAERKAYLVLCLARALARCGRKAGLIKLAELTADDRAVIAKSAHQELMVLTGVEVPRSRERWRQALVPWADTFEPQPWQRKLV